MHKYERLVKDRQKGFRASSNTISDHARFPSDPAWQRHAYLLAIDAEEENLFPTLRGAHALGFFAERRIHWWRSARGGDVVKDAAGRPRPEGPTRNMASSQIACVNVLMPFADSRPALTAMLQAIDPAVESVDVMRYQRAGEPAHESLVEFEWVGEGRSLEGTAGTRGASTTSADALLVGRMRDRRRKGFLMEWKLVEQYRDAESELDCASGATRRRRYAELYQNCDAFATNGRTLDDIAYDPIWQLMRMTLLGDLMVRRAMNNGSECGLDDFQVVVVCPRENEAYHDSVPALLRGTASAGRSPLETAATNVWPHGHLTFCDPQQLVHAARQVSTAAIPNGWSEYMRDRYAW